MEIQIPMNDLGAQYRRYKKEIDNAIQKIIDSTQFIGGSPVKSFEENLSKYLNNVHVIPCANGTDALQVALMACDLQRGDEVITTPFTFAATAEVVCLLGLTPIFVDIDPFTFCMNADLIEEAITPKTRCIIPVHLFGQCANMEQIIQIANANDLLVIEDAAQSLGSDYYMSNGDVVPSGILGDIGTTSFFPSKNLGCFGDGGAIFTKDAKLAQKIRMICNHGARKKYYHEIVGVNSRLDALQAAILDVKLKYVNEDINKRIKAADMYDTLLINKTDLEIPIRTAYSKHTFHQYTIRIKQGREEVIERLNSNNISCSIYYPLSLHVQEAFTNKKDLIKTYPQTETACEQVLSLPIFPDITEAQIEKVTSIL